MEETLETHPLFLIDAAELYSNQPGD